MVSNDNEIISSASALRLWCKPSAPPMTLEEFPNSLFDLLQFWNSSNSLNSAQVRSWIALARKCMNFLGLLAGPGIYGSGLVQNNFSFKTIIRNQLPGHLKKKLFSRWPEKLFIQQQLSGINLRALEIEIV